MSIRRHHGTSEQHHLLPGLKSCCHHDCQHNSQYDNRHDSHHEWVTVGIQI